MLPWFDPVAEEIRDKRTDQMSRRSLAARERANRVIADYRNAANIHGQATDDLVARAELVVGLVESEHE